MTYNAIKVALARSIIDPPRWVKVPSRDKKHLGVGSHILREGWVLQAFYGDNGLVFCTIIVELDPGPGEYVFKADFGTIGRAMAGNDLDDLKSRCIDMWYEEMSYMLTDDPVEEISDIDDLDATDDDDYVRVDVDGSNDDVYVGMDYGGDDDKTMLVIALPKPLPTEAQSPNLAYTIANAVHNAIIQGQAAVEEEQAAYRHGYTSMFDLMGQTSGGEEVSSEDYNQSKSPFADLMKKWTHRDPDEWQRQTHGDFEKLDSGN